MGQTGPLVTSCGNYNAVIGPCDPDPVRLFLPDREVGRFLLLGDHAGNAVPAALQSLGLQANALDRHIALDTGVQDLGERLAERLGAPFVSQAYSRLVIDCNRWPQHPASIAAVSDGTQVAGNADLTEAERERRRVEVFEPYHAGIGSAIDDLTSGGSKPVIVSLHSFTPRMDGFERPWEIGILHDGANDGFALAMLEYLHERSTLTIGDNEPYRMDETDYTLPAHTFARKLPYVEIEVRQDVLAEEPGMVCELLATALEACAAGIS